MYLVTWLISYSFSAHSRRENAMCAASVCVLDYVAEWVCVEVGGWQGAFPRAFSKRDLTISWVT